MNDGPNGNADTADLAGSEDVIDEKEALRQSVERNQLELRDAVEELTAAVKVAKTWNPSAVTRTGRLMSEIACAWQRAVLADQPW